MRADAGAFDRAGTDLVQVKHPRRVDDQTGTVRRANPAISSLDVAAPGGGADRASACLTMLSRSRAGASGMGRLAA